jgi:hypothetical protein
LTLPLPYTPQYHKISYITENMPTNSSDILSYSHAELSMNLQGTVVIWLTYLLQYLLQDPHTASIYTEQQ